jgi:hypothetical protein
MKTVFFKKFYFFQCRQVFDELVAYKENRGKKEPGIELNVQLPVHKF